VPIRVLLVDDNRVLRARLGAALTMIDGITVIGSCADGDEAVWMVARSRPDAVVMDLSMPRMDGVEATRRILADTPDTRVVIFTAAAAGQRTLDALAAGAAACIFKDATIDDLIAALRAE
jgi:DNA-binding NarL/FixJ family response regulator